MKLSRCVHEGGNPLSDRDELGVVAFLIAAIALRNHGHDDDKARIFLCEPICEI